MPLTATVPDRTSRPPAGAACLIVPTAALLAGAVTFLARVRALFSRILDLLPRSSSATTVAVPDRRSHVLGPHADADHPRRDAPQPRPAIEQPQRPRRLHGLVAVQHPVEDPLLEDDLDPLGHARREHPPALHGLEMARGQPAFEQRP